MLGSGLVKLLSGDPLWRGLTALAVHYETQPLPTPIAFFAHQAPLAFQRFSALTMFVVEVGLPILIFAGRWGRRVAFAGFVGLQLLIAATGNYGIFNLLAIALCLPLLDDGDLPSRTRRALARLDERLGRFGRRPWPRAVMWSAAALLGLLTTVQLSRVLPSPPAWPGPIVRLARAAAPFRSANFYGLFAVMTNPRYEIVLEGSDDGERWSEIPFRWKPQEVTKAPPFVAPHMPRLDWQMWFAALTPGADDVAWFGPFEARLMEGREEVWSLLAKGPFGPSHPPRFLRALRYEVHFTDVKTLRASGCWWRRTRSMEWAPEATLAR
jgi:hypothetical protein